MADEVSKLPGAQAGPGPQTQLEARPDTDGEAPAEVEVYEGEPQVGCDKLGASDTPQWLATIGKVKPGIVALRVTGTRAFEDGNPGTWSGTGFVVDAEAGLILTNRHVVTASPIRAVAYFDQNEELPCEPLYRDPCHDFGLLRFNPALLEFTAVVDIPLRPEELAVGTEIRVVGNDNSEKLQILAGTVARVDRNAPQYTGLYSDENTFYVGAASATSGGSSGSPVINIRGHVIALNAGGAQDAASAYYLPLDRVVYAVQALREGRVPKRGTVGCRLIFRPYATAERLGLNAAQKAVAVTANAALSHVPRRGVLVCDRVLPGSAAAEAGVQPGDVLLAIRGASCVDFVQMECAVDAAAPEPWSGAIGDELEFVWARLGAVRTTSLLVADLHPLIPRDFVECGAAVFHAISYQRAMRWNIGLESAGVYISLAGIFGAAGAGAAVIELAHGCQVWPTPDIDALFHALQELPDDAYFRMRFRDWSGTGHGRERSAEVRMDRRLWPLAIWRFIPGPPNDWTMSAATTAPRSLPAPSPQDGEMEDLPGMSDVPSTSLRRAIAEVTFFAHTRLVLEGIKPRGMSATLFRRRGVGIVFDVEHRLLLTSRSTVPQLLGTVEVIFAQSLTIDAVPLLIHPELSLVVLQLRRPFPKGVIAARLLDSPDSLFDTPQRGSFVGLGHRGHPVEREECTVTLDEVWNPPILNPPRPRQGINCELLQALNDQEISDGFGGIFYLSGGSVPDADTDKSAEAAAIFIELMFDGSPECHYIVGLPISVVRDVAAAGITLASSSKPSNDIPVVTFASLELELRELSFAEAMKRKALSTDALAAVAARRPLRKTTVVVERLLNGGAASKAGLREGDLLLRVAGHPIAGPFDLQHALSPYAGKSVQLELWRGGALQAIEVEVAALPADGTTRCLCWHGMMCVRTPRAYEEVWGRKPGTPPGVTILSVLLGSPSGEEEGFRSNVKVSTVDGRPVRDLDDLCFHTEDKVSCIADQSIGTGSQQPTVVVSLVDGDGHSYVRTLRPDPIFWPTVELRLTPDGWVRTLIDIECSKSA